MNKQTEALKMAIEAMIDANDIIVNEWSWEHDESLEAIQACKEALEQPAQEYLTRAQQVIRANNSAQEPVAWTDLEGNFSSVGTAFFHPFPLYLHPAPSWKGLNDDERVEILAKVLGIKRSEVNLMDLDCAHAIEQALKEKND